MLQVSSWIINVFNTKQQQPQMASPIFQEQWLCLEMLLDE